MTRTIVLVALMAFNVAYALDRVSTAFDKSVGPCTDLFGHVCVDKPEVRKFQDTVDRGLVNAIATILKKQGGDPVLNSVLEAIYKEDNKTESQKKQCRLEGYGVTEADIESQSEYKLGTLYAEMLVHGRFGEYNCPLFMWCKGVQDNRKNCTLIGNGFTILNEHKFGEVRNQFIKGVVDRFVELGGFDFGAEDYVEYPNVTSSDLVSNMTAETEWEMIRRVSTVAQDLTRAKNDDTERVNADRFFKTLALPQSFAAYGNVLFAHTLYTNRDKLNPDVAEDLQKLTKKIQEEVLQNIQDSDWLTEGDKKSLIDHMHSLKVNIGVPQKYRNVTLLEEMLKRYRTAFANTPLDGKCDLEMLTRTHGYVRHQMIYEGFGAVNALSMRSGTDLSIFVRNAFHNDGSIIINPAILHVLNDYSLSTGFKYGLLGTVIGHEIFHGFGLKIENLPEHLQEVASRPHYKKQQKCYADFYGNKKFCLPGRQDEEHCPNGAKKATEGYCDVESARVVFPLLKKALGASRKKRSPEDADYLPLFRWRPPGVPEEEALLFDNIEDELKQYFYGVQLFNCALNPTESYIQRQLNDVHPRNQIRANALAQQIPEFSEIFKCKAGDKNYRVPPEEMCAVYPRRNDTAFPPPGTEQPQEAQIKHSCGKPKSRALLVLLFAVFFLSV